MTIVGTRRATSYGARATEGFGSAFAVAGITVVSGLALGIDTRAHKAALDMGGLTVAVLGCGADVVYPRRNGWLYEKIAQTGVVLSELPPGCAAGPLDLPAPQQVARGAGRRGARGGGTSGEWGIADSRSRGWNWAGRCSPCPARSTREGYKGCNRLLHDGAGRRSTLAPRWRTFSCRPESKEETGR